MAMIPYMAGGYAIDRMMGGDGKVGLALGTGVGGFGTGTFAGALGGEAATAGATAAATEGAVASTSPLLFSTPASAGGSGLGGLGGAGMFEGASLGTVNPMTTGGFSESISPFTPLGGAGVGGNTGFLGQPISNQVMNSALTGEKGLLNYGLENTFVQDGFDFINEGWDGMSFMDKANTGMLGSQAIDAVNAPPEQLQVAQPQMKPAKQPTVGSPLAINVQAPNTNLYKDPRKLYEERYGY